MATIGESLSCLLDKSERPRSKILTLVCTYCTFSWPRSKTRAERRHYVVVVAVAKFCPKRFENVPTRLICTDGTEVDGRRSRRHVPNLGPTFGRRKKARPACAQSMVEYYHSFVRAVLLPEMGRRFFPWGIACGGEGYHYYQTIINSSIFILQIVTT
jgi:hypothetical protein